MKPEPTTTSPFSDETADVDLEYALLCAFGDEPGREVPARALRRAVSELGLDAVVARHLVARAPVLVPSRRGHYRLRRAPARG